MMLVAARRLMVVLVVALAASAWPATAAAAGCEVLRDPRDRAECVARQQARDAARAEVQRQVDDAAPTAAAGGDEPRSAAWEQALDEAGGFDATELVEPRLLAAVGGLAWFVLALRARRRARRRTHGRGA